MEGEQEVWWHAQSVLCLTCRHCGHSAILGLPAKSPRTLRCMQTSTATRHRANREPSVQTRLGQPRLWLLLVASPNPRSIPADTHHQSVPRHVVSTRSHLRTPQSPPQCADAACSKHVLNAQVSIRSPCCGLAKFASFHVYRLMESRQKMVRLCRVSPGAG